MNSEQSKILSGYNLNIIFWVRFFTLSFPMAQDAVGSERQKGKE
jgi:hypothetical protein